MPLAALEHHAYCPRQAALIHVDAYFESNVDTVRGDIAHAAVDRAGPDRDRDGHKIWHSLPVWSIAFRLHGICDVVEFTDDGPVPIEHKSGSYRPGDPAGVQVAGQVLCLREMFRAPVSTGIIFAGQAKRRHTVVVDDPLATRVVEVADAMRELLVAGTVPPPVNDHRCRRCSLRPGCEPEMPIVSARSLFIPRPVDDRPSEGLT